MLNKHDLDNIRGIVQDVVQQNNIELRKEMYTQRARNVLPVWKSGS